MVAAKTAAERAGGGGAVKAVVSANMEAVGRAGSPHSNAGENP